MAKIRGAADCLDHSVSSQRGVFALGWLARRKRATGAHRGRNAEALAYSSHRRDKARRARALVEPWAGSVGPASRAQNTQWQLTEPLAARSATALASDSGAAPACAPTTGSSEPTTVPFNPRLAGQPSERATSRFGTPDLPNQENNPSGSARYWSAGTRSALLRALTYIPTARPTSAICPATGQTPPSILSHK